jgi:hypothetical protein
MSSEPSDSRKQKLRLLEEELHRLHTEKSNANHDQFYKTEQFQTGIQVNLIAIECEYTKAEGRHKQKQLEQAYLYYKPFLEK